MRVIADTNKEVGGDGTSTSGHPVNFDKDQSVVITVQLVKYRSGS